MLDEEVIVKTSRNSNERLLTANIIAVMGFVTLVFGGNTDIAMGLFITMGIVAIINVYNYSFVWIDAQKYNAIKYTLTLIPYIVSFGIACVGIMNPSILPLTVGSQEYFELNPDQSKAISSAVGGALLPISMELVTLACVATAASIYFITDSRYIIRRILFFCSCTAAGFAAVGLIYAALLQIKQFNLPNIGEFSFSTFPDASQWSAFALIWMGAALAVAAYSAQRFRIFTFAKSLRFYSLLTATILFASIVVCGKWADKLAAYSIAFVACFTLIFDTLPTKTNIARHWTSKYKSSSEKRKLTMLAIPCACYAILAICLFAAGAVLLSKFAAQADIYTLTEPTASATINERQALISDSVKLFEMKPLFGWGTASFQNAFAFFQGNDLGESTWLSPNSDLLHKLIENGIVGIILMVIMPLCFIVRWLIRRDFGAASLIMMLTVMAILMISLIGYPFQCIAVKYSFWVLMMSFLCWDKCEVR